MAANEERTRQVRSSAHAGMHARSCAEIASSPGGMRWVVATPALLPVGREISRMTVVFVRLERLVSILAGQLPPLSFPFRSPEYATVITANRCCYECRQIEQREFLRIARMCVCVQISKDL